mmetsp:Transcript_5158/g.13400  ORF Transcript_5158/g.13400 Transcript_5158/m.13400 type:complete len:363 (-) Transcript_5158:506-1594(-)
MKMGGRASERERERDLRARGLLLLSLDLRRLLLLLFSLDLGLLRRKCGWEGNLRHGRLARWRLCCRRRLLISQFRHRRFGRRLDHRRSLFDWNSDHFHGSANVLFEALPAFCVDDLVRGGVCERTSKSHLEQKVDLVRKHRRASRRTSRGEHDARRLRHFHGICLHLGDVLRSRILRFGHLLLDDFADRRIGRLEWQAVLRHPALASAKHVLGTRCLLRHLARGPSVAVKQHVDAGVLRGSRVGKFGGKGPRDAECVGNRLAHARLQSDGAHLVERTGQVGLSVPSRLASRAYVDEHVVRLGALAQFGVHLHGFQASSVSSLRGASDSLSDVADGGSDEAEHGERASDDKDGLAVNVLLDDG